MEGRAEGRAEGRGAGGGAPPECPCPTCASALPLLRPPAAMDTMGTSLVEEMKDLRQGQGKGVDVCVSVCICVCVCMHVRVRTSV